MYSFLTYLLILSTCVSLGLLMLPNDAHVLMEWNPPSTGDYGMEMISKWLCSKKKKKKNILNSYFFFLPWLDPFLDKTKKKGIFKRSAVWLHRKDLWHSLLRDASDQNGEGIILAASVFSFSHVCSVVAEFSSSIMKHFKDRGEKKWLEEKKIALLTGSWFWKAGRRPGAEMGQSRVLVIFHWTHTFGRGWWQAPSWEPRNAGTWSLSLRSAWVSSLELLRIGLEKMNNSSIFPFWKGQKKENGKICCAPTLLTPRKLLSNYFYVVPFYPCWLL